MPPIVGGIGLPEGKARSEHGAIKHCRKLHKAAEEGGLANGDRDGLDQPCTRVGLHRPHHLDQAVAGHDGICIEHNHVLIIRAPTLAKVGNIPNFAANVFLAAAIKRLFGKVTQA